VSVPSLDLAATGAAPAIYVNSPAIESFRLAQHRARTVELFLNAVKGFFPNLAPRPQALQCRALGGDRA
jgi:hypothetical protein